MNEHRAGDRVAAIVLLVVSALLAAALAFAGLFLVMASDSCGSSSVCDTSLLSTGWILSVVLPVVGFVATLIVTVVRMTKGLRAWWVPIAGTVIFCLLYAGAVALVFSAVD